MYTQFFGLTKAPFSLIPDPGFLYLSDHHKKALNTLKYGILQQIGFTVITGGIGSGKTTLLRMLLDNMEPACKIGIITNTHPSLGNLLDWILNAFNIEHSSGNEAERYQIFRTFITKQKLKNRRVLLVVDEAQNLDIPTLEELRLLSNINDGQKDATLQIILSGQSELLDKLNAPTLVQFTQRIAIEYHLNPLNYEETIQYVAHRLKMAGGQASIFSRQALFAVFQYSGGIPRVINNICDMAMVFAFANSTKVEYETVMEVVNERRTGGIIKPNPVSDFLSVTSLKSRPQSHLLKPYAKELTLT